MPGRSAVDWVLEALAFVALVGVIATAGVHWTELPAQVPRHFGFSGIADKWGDKNEMLLLPLTAIGLYILMTAASRYQTLINIPMAIDRDAPEVRRLLQSMSIALKLVLVLVFLYLEWTVVNTALGRSSGLGRRFLPIVLVATFLPVGLYMHKLRRHKK